MDKSDRPTNFQFSIARLLVATAVVAFVFGVLKWLLTLTEWGAIIPTAFIAAAAGALVLVGGKRDVAVILWYVVLVILVLLLMFLAFVAAHLLCRRFGQ